MKQTTKLKTQAQAVVHFIQQLDIEMVDSLLDDRLEYQDMRKDLFINKLGHAFNEFIEAGDTFLLASKGFCNSVICNFQCKGYSFTGNNSGSFLDMIIEIEDGKVIDMYECTHFKTEVKTNIKNKRVEIDKMIKWKPDN
jgi:hypothetical protein